MQKIAGKHLYLVCKGYQVVCKGFSIISQQNYIAIYKHVRTESGM